jgi:cold shock CspA family protein
MAPMTGTIKRLVSDKGFGFVAAQDGNEYFFHQSACADTRFDDRLGRGNRAPRTSGWRNRHAAQSSPGPSGRRRTYGLPVLQVQRPEDDQQNH